MQKIRKKTLDKSQSKMTIGAHEAKTKKTEWTKCQTIGFVDEC